VADPIEPKPNCLTRQLCTWSCLLPTFVILLILLWLAWVPQPYESDQIAKAGKVLYMSDNGLLFKPAQPPEFYIHDNKFSLYYMLQTVVHLIFKGNIFLEMNLAVAVCGALFFAATATALRAALGLPQWLTGLLAINTPALRIHTSPTFYC
jgi:hypothetical protein